MSRKQILIACFALLGYSSVLTAGMTLKEAQEALAAKGLYHGPVDGVTGPKTRQALTDFQKSAGLPVTGKLDDRTVGKLSTGMSSKSQASHVKGAADTSDASVKGAAKDAASSTKSETTNAVSGNSDTSVKGAAKEAGSSAKEETSGAAGEIKGVFGSNKPKNPPKK